MKGKRFLISTLAVALIVGAGVSAYAASPEARDAAGSMLFDVQTYAEGKMPAIPEGASILDKEVIFTEDEIDVNLNTYAEGDLPAIPEGAAIFVKEVVSTENEMIVNLETYAEGDLPAIPEGAQLMNKTVVTE